MSHARLVTLSRQGTKQTTLIIQFPVVVLIYKMNSCLGDREQNYPFFSKKKKKMLPKTIPP